MACGQGTRMARVMGAVLTGGRSSRFGSDKGAALFDGATLADHAAAAIAPFVGEVVRVGGVGGIADLPVPGLGPLGGIAAALDHAGRRGFDSVVTIGCDMPRVPAGLVEALLQRSPSYCVEAPVLGHWPVFAFDMLRDLLCFPAKAGTQPGSARSHMPRMCEDRPGDDPTSHSPSRENKEEKTGPSIKSWARAIGAIPIDSPAPIANVNTTADLLAL